MSAAIPLASAPRVGECVDHESFHGLGVLLSGILGIRALDGNTNEASAPEPPLWAPYVRSPGPALHSWAGPGALTQSPPMRGLELFFFLRFY